MQNQLYAAISNNCGLYEAIFSANNLNYFKSDASWYTLEKVPPLYSNLITLSSEWKPDDIFSQINKNHEKNNWGGWSIKDSFGILDLKSLGFRKLFDSAWIFLDRNNFKPVFDNHNLRYEMIKDVNEFLEWRTAWNPDKSISGKIFSQNLLKNPLISFIAGYDNDRIVGGCLVNKTGALGISNFFSPDGNIEYWSNMIRYIFDKFEENNIVGYERADALDTLSQLGYEKVGNLAVWLKN